ncbi:MAG: hypothetical protein OEZ06_03755 [Myxococcales bacterium]|nr:hypothetical protein [Myxococcales bacterium]
MLGGQTGALMPDCGLSPAGGEADILPGGGAGIVVYTDVCGVAAATEALELRDGSGIAVDFDLERLDDGVVLLRPAMELPPGDYELTGPDGMIRQLAIADSKPLPERIGQLDQVGVGCDIEFELQLDPSLREYVPLLKLDVRVNGGEVRTWIDYGTLPSEPGGDSVLTLPNCFPRCLRDGVHEVTVEASLAGEEVVLPPVSAEALVDCAEASRPLACSARSPRERATGPWLAALATVALALGRRRCRRSRPPG